jgi:hypothetical protein
MLLMGPIYDRYGERTAAPLLTLFAISTMLLGMISLTIPWALAGSCAGLGISRSLRRPCSDWGAARPRRNNEAVRWAP